MLGKYGTGLFAAFMLALIILVGGLITPNVSFPHETFQTRTADQARLIRICKSGYKSCVHWHSTIGIPIAALECCTETLNICIKGLEEEEL